jgi:hypothetical protein
MIWCDRLAVGCVSFIVVGLLFARWCAKREGFQRCRYCEKYNDKHDHESLYGWDGD